MSEVMVITSGNKTTFEGRADTISNNGNIHSRNGSVRSLNGARCRCVTSCEKISDTLHSLEKLNKETVVKKESKSTQTCKSINGGIAGKGLELATATTTTPSSPETERC